MPQFIPKGSISDHYDTWTYELKNDVDKSFLLEGIRHGFRISDIDDSSSVTSVSVENHPSVQKFYELVDCELKRQIQAGNYMFANDLCHPKIVSPLGAIPKDTNEVRIIHDCSRPLGESLNDYSLHEPVHYQCIGDAYNLASQSTYMCKIDLKSAYRSVAIHPLDYCLTGFRFKFAEEDTVQTLYDIRLPFGSSKGPMVFNRLSQAVKRMMSRRGYNNIVVYLDDFLIVEKSYEKCVEAQRVLLSLLVKLGFQISWKKVVGPCQRIEFLGVTIDTIDCTASLGEAKLAVLYDKLLCFSLKTRASKRQLQSLAGSLNWACQVIQGGRYFLRRILDSINKLKLASHKCKLSAEFRKDLDWWLCYLREFNGVLYYRQVGSAVVHTDACVEGAGIFVNGQWYYVNWRQDFPHLAGLHINYKEVMAAILGVCHFAPILAGCDVTIVTDSTAAKGILNKGRCRSPMVMEWLRLLFWTSLNYNLRIRALHCPGLLNQLPDAISRLHEPGQVLRLYSLLSNWYHGVPSVHFASECGLCMSPASFQVVAPHLERWGCRLS